MSIYDVGSGKHVISIQQAIQYAQAAGFTGTALVNAVAIAMAESGLDTNSANTTTSGIGIDRGIVKFNSVFHPEVSDACAYDPACAFKEFYRVSQGGTNFCQWCTYNANCAHPCNANGPYKANVAAVQAALGTSGQTSNTSSSLVGSALGIPQAALDWLGNPMRIAKIIVGFLLVGIALYLLVSPEAEKQTTNFIKKNPEVLAA